MTDRLITLATYRFAPKADLTILQNNPQLLDAGSRNETEAEDHTACLACGERMPDDADRCKACGWSYDSEVIDEEDG
jgi:hypothetical protein